MWVVQRESRIAELYFSKSGRLGFTQGRLSKQRAAVPQRKRPHLVQPMVGQPNSTSMLACWPQRLQGSNDFAKPTQAVRFSLIDGDEHISHPPSWQWPALRIPPARYSQALPLRLARFSFKPRAVAGERSAVPIKPGTCSDQQDHKNQQGGAPDPEHETEQQNNGHLGRPFLNKVNGPFQRSSTGSGTIRDLPLCHRAQPIEIGLGTSASNSASGSILHLLPSKRCAGGHYLAYS